MKQTFQKIENEGDSVEVDQDYDGKVHIQGVDPDTADRVKKEKAKHALPHKEIETAESIAFKQVRYWLISMFTFQSLAYVAYTILILIKFASNLPAFVVTIIGLQPLLLILGLALVYKSQSTDYLWLTQPALLTLSVYTILTIFMLSKFQIVILSNEPMTNLLLQANIQINVVSVFLMNMSLNKQRWPCIIASISLQNLVSIYASFQELEENQEKTPTTVQSLILVAFVFAFLICLKVLYTYQKTIEKNLDWKNLSQDELQQIIRSLDEGIVITKYRGDTPNGNPSETRHFTNYFIDAIFGFACGGFENNTESLDELMNAKIFQLDHDQNFELARLRYPEADYSAAACQFTEWKKGGAKDLKQGQTYSAQDLSVVDQAYLANCSFMIQPLNREVNKTNLGTAQSLQSVLDEEKYVQIKFQRYKFGAVTVQIFQMACVTCSIHFERAITQSTCAKLMTQTVSHELRNPLNCIMMQQDASKVYIKKIVELMSGRKEDIIDDIVNVQSQIRAQAKMLEDAHKISKTSSKMMLFNCEDLLDFGQMENGDFRKNLQKFNLQQCLQEIIDVQMYKAKDKKIDLDLTMSHFMDGSQIESSNCNVVSDSQRIQQIVLNFVSNALKFTPYSGFIKVKCAIRRFEDKAQNDVFIEVQDNGFGISDENQKSLFQLFGFIKDTSSMNKKGVGLGLAISKKIVQEFGGEIGVKSQLKEGSTFFFNVKLEDEDAFKADNIFIEFDDTYSDQFIDKSFINGQGQGQILNMSKSNQTLSQIEDEQNVVPVKRMETSTIVNYQQKLFDNDDDKKALSEAGIGIGQFTSRQPEIVNPQFMQVLEETVSLKDDVGEAKGQILIVDDDLLNRFALKTLLQLCNFDVNSQSVLVENGVLAVNEVRNRGLKTFSLILMDVNMPQMDGFEATRQITAHFIKKGMTPPTIIGLTGDLDQGTINTGTEAGMSKVLGKPVRKNQLLRILKGMQLVK